MVDYVKLAKSCTLMSGTLYPDSDSDSETNSNFTDTNTNTATSSTTLTEEITSYNDRIITCKPDDLKNINYNPNQKTILKLTEKLTEQFNDFNFSFEKDGYHVYINQLAKTMCPTIIDGKVAGSAVVLIVTCDNKQFIVFVKDRTKKILTLTAGTINNSSESFEECAKREVFEETGFDISQHELIKCAHWTFVSTVFKMKFEGQTVGFYVHVTITEGEMNKMKSYNDAEIEYVKLVNITNLEKLRFDTYSQHHVMMARHTVSKVNTEYVYDWNTDENKPNYLKSYELC